MFKIGETDETFPGVVTGGAREGEGILLRNEWWRKVKERKEVT